MGNEYLLRSSNSWTVGSVDIFCFQSIERSFGEIQRKDN